MTRFRRRTKHHSLESSQIGLTLHSYEEIFSDFDPRSYAERSLSDDFLAEIKRASKDKPYDGIELAFLIPARQRNKSHEETIKKRLRNHFKHHYDILTTERSHISRQGWLFILLGVITMFLAATLLHEDSSASIITSFLIIVLEPAGWFLFWEGLNLIIFTSRDRTVDYDFYDMMTDAKITFKGV